MRQLLTRLSDQRFLRYFLASVGALAVDMGCFIALLTAGIGAVGASAAGYALGILAHWLLSSRAVFTDTVAAHGPERTWQKGLFVISALLGLALTTAIVAWGEALGIDARLSKIAAIFTSFFATWLMRSRFVFRASGGKSA